MAISAANLISAEQISKAYGTRILLDELSLGIGAGEVVGVVGRNGDGKTTLLRILTGEITPDAGKITRARDLTLGFLAQLPSSQPGQSVRDLLIGGQPDHVWAADPKSRAIVTELLADLELDRQLSELSGGERRRAELAKLLIDDPALLVLDEPTNHLDVAAVAWLAGYLAKLRDKQATAMLIVSHDRWFLDEVCTRIWEVHDATVDAYDGGYAAYILARAERARQAQVTETKRRNLVRKELAWLRRGAPARTSKPKFRIEAANALIADVPELRDKLALQKFAMTRLGKDVIDLAHMGYQLPDGRTLFDQLTWSIGPGDRIGLIGVNGSGKSTLLALLAKELKPTSGKVKHGKTLRIGQLSQQLAELDPDDRVLASVKRLSDQVKLATGRQASATNLLEDFGFTGDRLVTRLGELSGGEKRRLQFLRLLISEPNLLLLDEPTNDLDIDSLQVIEDYLDSWPGTLIVASHDRYFLERVTDVQYAITADGGCVLLPGGVDQYLAMRQAGGGVLRNGQLANQESAPAPAQPKASRSTAANSRELKKQLAKLESQLAKASTKIDALHAEMAASASDYAKLTELQSQLDAQQALHDQLEEDWLTTAAELEA